jgi:hypothetical protein
VKYRLAQTYSEHLLQPWAGGWRCWVCPRWSHGRLEGRCASLGEVSQWMGLLGVPAPDVTVVSRAGVLRPLT